MKPDKPSSTALFVAQGLRWVADHPRLHVEMPDMMAQFNREIIDHLPGGLFPTSSWAGGALTKVKASLMQRFSVPGFYLHFVARKKCIEAFVREFIQGGGEQLVVIGAGFDTLSLCLADEFPRIRVIEIDHPATQAWKRRCLEGSPIRERIDFLPLDLTKGSLRELLPGSEVYDTGKSTVFVAEGLLMYLSEREIRDMLATIREIGGTGSRLVFTYMEELAPGDYQFRNATKLMRLWLRWKRELFTWGLKNGQLAGFLGQSGFRLLGYKTHQDFRSAMVSEANKGASLAIGENVALAEADP
jgi:methyltransferase (TIGR00027 family)